MQFSYESFSHRDLTHAFGTAVTFVQDKHNQTKMCCVACACKCAVLDLAARTNQMIRIDAIWIATVPMDKLAGGH